jgi:hypothetical protein
MPNESTKSKTISDTSRQMTVDECRAALLRHVWGMIQYWDQTPNCGDQRNRLEGVAFSILAALDGSAGGLPGWIVAPSPHPDDKDYNIRHGENWWPTPPQLPCDVAGCLHEKFHDVGRQTGLLRGKQ